MHCSERIFNQSRFVMDLWYKPDGKKADNAVYLKHAQLNTAHSAKSSTLVLDLAILVCILIGLMVGANMRANANEAPPNMESPDNAQGTNQAEQDSTNAANAANTANTNPTPINSKSLFGITKLVLRENFSQTVLSADGTCMVDDTAPTNPVDLSESWKMLNEYADIADLSDLAILEQVKREIQKTKMVMPIEQSANTQLSIEYDNGRVQNLSLRSADTMLQTYPNARMLAHFMQVVTVMRDVNSKCQVQSKSD